jgi:hypothetical protein
MSKYDRRGHENRESFVKGSNVTEEAAVGDPPDKNRSLSRRHHPQKSPFSSAAQECDMAVTPENFDKGKGHQPR